MPIKSVEINCADSKGLHRLGKRNERDLKRVKKGDRDSSSFQGQPARVLCLKVDEGPRPL